MDQPTMVENSATKIVRLPAMFSERNHIVDNGNGELGGFEAAQSVHVATSLYVPTGLTWDLSMPTHLEFRSVWSRYLWVSCMASLIASCHWDSLNCMLCAAS